MFKLTLFVIGDAKFATDIVKELIVDADFYFSVAPPPILTASPSYFSAAPLSQSPSKVPFRKVNIDPRGLIACH
jgi:hypothetical protein